MPQLYGWSKSNYFRVKDDAAFEAWCESGSIRFEKLPNGEYCMFGNRDDHLWNFEPPLDDNEEEMDNEEEIDFPKELARHLHDDYVAVLLGATREGPYMRGWASAVNSKGEERTLALDEIYERAKGLGKIVTDG